MPPGIGYGPPMGDRPMVPGPGPTAPAAVSTRNDGRRAEGVVATGIAVKLLEQVVPMFGAETPEGSAVLKALTGLAKIAAPTNDQVTASEMKLLGANAPAVPPQQGGAPVDIRERLARFGLGQANVAGPANAA